MRNKLLAVSSAFCTCLALAVGWIPDGWWVQQAFTFIAGFMLCTNVFLCLED